MASESKRIPIAPGLFTLPSSEGEEAHLIGSRCNACAEVFFPKRVICAKCFSGDIEEVPLSRRGKVYTFTVVRQAPPQYEGPIPYVLGHVELPEGVLVPAAITGIDPESVKTGLDVELVIEKLKDDPDGNEVMTYKFKPEKRAA